VEKRRGEERRGEERRGEEHVGFSRKPPGKETTWET
jgi:hypothetical protein